MPSVISASSTVSPISRHREPCVAAHASPSVSRRPIAAAAVTWAIIPVTSTIPIDWSTAPTASAPKLPTMPISSASVRSPPDVGGEVDQDREDRGDQDRDRHRRGGDQHRGPDGRLRVEPDDAERRRRRCRRARAGAAASRRACARRRACPARTRAGARSPTAAAATAAGGRGRGCAGRRLPPGRGGPPGGGGVGPGGGYRWSPDTGPT